jgi:hypothetical protein
MYKSVVCFYILKYCYYIAYYIASFYTVTYRSLPSRITEKIQKKYKNPKGLVSEFLGGRYDYFVYSVIFLF